MILDGATPYVPRDGTKVASFFISMKSKLAAPSGVTTTWADPLALVVMSTVKVPPPVAAAVLSGLGVFSFQPSGHIAEAINNG